jgi:hypothetical protein
MTDSIRDLRYERSKFVLQRLDQLRSERIAKKLESAPMEVRALGLLLAVARWDRDDLNAIAQLVADWLYNEWGLLPHRATPQGGLALLGALQNDAKTAPRIFSAAEIEAVQIVQTAKVVVGALKQD